MADYKVEKKNKELGSQMRVWCGAYPLGAIVASRGGFGSEDLSFTELEATVRHGVVLEPEPVEFVGREFKYASIASTFQNLFVSSNEPNIGGDALDILTTLVGKLPFPNQGAGRGGLMEGSLKRLPKDTLFSHRTDLWDNSHRVIYRKEVNGDVTYMEM